MKGGGGVEKHAGGQHLWRGWEPPVETGQRRAFFFLPFKGEGGTCLRWATWPRAASPGYNTGPAQLQCIYMDLMDIYNISCLLTRQTRLSLSLEEHSQGWGFSTAHARHVPNFLRRTVEGLLTVRLRRRVSRF